MHHHFRGRIQPGVTEWMYLGLKWTVIVMVPQTPFRREQQLVLSNDIHARTMIMINSHALQVAGVLHTHVYLFQRKLSGSSRTRSVAAASCYASENGEPKISLTVS